MTKREQREAFEGELLNLCQRYLNEFDIDAMCMMYVWLKVTTEIFGDIVELDEAD